MFFFHPPLQVLHIIHTFISEGELGSEPWELREGPILDQLCVSQTLPEAFWGRNLNLT